MDRVFTKHLALTLKLFIPCLAGAWLSLIWAGETLVLFKPTDRPGSRQTSPHIVKPNNTGGLFAIMAIIGVTSLTLLPVGLELACDLTQDAEASSSLMWFAGNAFGIIFVLCKEHLSAQTRLAHVKFLFVSSGRCAARTGKRFTSFQHAERPDLPRSRSRNRYNTHNVRTR